MTTDSDTLAIGNMTPRARSELLRSQARVAPGHASAAEYKRAAATASDASNRRPSDLNLIESLIMSNADYAAAASIDVASFPDQTTVLGLLAIANLETALGRAADLGGDREAALQHFMSALAMLQRFRAHARMSTLDSAIYGVASRAATVVGELAADRGLTIADLLRRLDENIITPYARLMSTGELSGPRAFAVVALLRRALSVAPEYLAARREEMRRLQATLTPVDERAAKRFRMDIAAILREAETALSGEDHVAFKW